MIKISPSLLSADIAHLAEEIKKIERYVDMLHVDVMDGVFVPNISYGPAFAQTVDRITKLPFESHLMIIQPSRHIEAFAKAGSDIITIHVETDDHLDRTISFIQSLGVKAGVCLNPSTPLSHIDHVIDKIDHLLIMTVNPGFGGQKFLTGMIPKITSARKMITKAKRKIPIEVDGGINAKTAPMAVHAGADILVSGSYIYSHKDPQKAIESLRKAK